MKKLFTLIFFFIFVACISSHKELSTSEVDIETLRKILINQKCHNKAIFIFDPGCSVCMFNLHNEYPVMQNKFSNSLDYVFISVDTIPLEEYKLFFNAIGIKVGHLFSINENNPDYLLPSGKVNFLKMVQYLFSTEKDVCVWGFPISAIANKNNNLKLEYYLMGDSSIIIRPQPWYRLNLSNLDEIDFSIIDTCSND
jgi:hypothetical protein